MNIPYLIFIYIEHIIILPIILTFIVKYLAERRGWNSPYEKTYCFVSIWCIFYFTLLLLFIELPDYLDYKQIIDYPNSNYNILITSIIILILDTFFTIFMIKIIYKKDIRDSLIFSLIIVGIKIILIIGFGFLLSPLGVFIQDL